MKFLRALALLPALAGSASARDTEISYVVNSDNETGFQLEKRPVGGVFTLLALLPAGATGFVDHLGEGGDCYRVRAINEVGESAYAGPVCLGFPPNAPSGMSIKVVTTTTLIIQ